jgi:hypothetical protein
MTALPTIVELADIAGATYTRTDPFCEVLGSSFVIFRSVRPTDGVVEFGIEGTHNDQGWSVDFVAIGAEPHVGVDHPTLGFVHAGIYAACATAFPKILPDAKKAPVIISGHSLGGGGAIMLGAMCAVDGCPPLMVGAFAPPLVGAAKLVGITKSFPLFACQYGQDPVPEVPIPLWPFFPYQQVPLTHFPAPYTVDPLDIPARIAFHHWPNYAAGARAYQATLTASP